MLAGEGGRTNPPPDMQQVLLAVLALGAFGFAALTHQKSASQVETTAVRQEVEMAALELAQAWMSRAERLAFDEADVGEDAFRLTTTGLTDGAAFGGRRADEADEDGIAEADDLDDLDGFSLAVDHPWGSEAGGTLPFTLSISVRYTSPSSPGVPAVGTELAKEVEVRVENRGRGGALLAPVTLRRVLTPAGLSIHG